MIKILFVCHGNICLKGGKGFYDKVLKKKRI